MGYFTQQSSGGGSSGFSEEYIIGVRNPAYQVGYNPIACIGCFNCVDACVAARALSYPTTSTGDRVVIDYTKCIGAKDCMSVCPAEGDALFV